MSSSESDLLIYRYFEAEPSAQHGGPFLFVSLWGTGTRATEGFAALACSPITTARSLRRRFETGPLVESAAIGEMLNVGRDLYFSIALPERSHPKGPAYVPRFTEIDIKSVVQRLVRQDAATLMVIAEVAKAGPSPEQRAKAGQFLEISKIGDVTP